MLIVLNCTKAFHEIWLLPFLTTLLKNGITLECFAPLWLKGFSVLSKSMVFGDQLRRLQINSTKPQLTLLPIKFLMGEEGILPKCDRIFFIHFPLPLYWGLPNEALLSIKTRKKFCKKKLEKEKTCNIYSMWLSIAFSSAPALQKCVLSVSLYQIKQFCENKNTCQLVFQQYLFNSCISFMSHNRA